MIQPQNFFVVRQPTYPFNKLGQFYEQLTTQSLDNLLREHYQDSLAQEAIFAASPTLHERLQRWLSGETLPEQDKLLATLHKYLIRMCSRPTPYGLFAGCALGSFGEHTQFRAGSAGTLRTHTRVDVDCLLAIRAWLTKQPAIRAQLQLVPNSSLYPVGSSLRYVEQQQQAGQRHYFISAVEGDHHLDTALAAARAGATIGQLTDVLVDDGAQPDEATAFIEQLIESQLLMFGIEPTVTGLHSLSRLAEQTANLTNAEAVTADLRQLLAALDQPNRAAGYAQVSTWLAERGIQRPTADVVQVDTFFDNEEMKISERAMQHLQRNLEKLMVLNQPHHCPELDEFKRRFHNRYEDEEIPLAMALDNEFGVGYGTGSTLGVGYAPLIDDLRFSKAEITSTTAWDWWQRLVMDKYAETLRLRQEEVVLTDEDLTFIASRQGSTAPLPCSFYVFGTLLASSEQAVDNGDFRFNLLAYRGPSGLNLISRFCEGKPQLLQHLREMAIQKELHHPDVVFAEIVHLPEDRVGNILIRPTIHAYEIPYLGQASVPPDYQIPLTDLLVSVRNNTIILRSKRLNKRVIPRLTNAHNFTNGLPIYRFLCDLQAQDVHLNVAWDWGVLRSQTYLPRVRYRNVIVSRATWQLNSHDLTPDNPLRLVAQLTAAGLPDQFVLAQGDNELYIAMHVPASLDLLATEIRKHKQVRLVEFLATPDRCPLARKRDRFTHEIIIPFQDSRAPVLPGLSQTNRQLPQRKFSVGSEWFYLKIYTGEKSSDALLVQTIYPVVKQLVATQIVQEFFFLRYKDTDPHLRLRFRGNPHVGFYQYVVKALERALHESVEAGVVYRVQVDTYQREMERYGLENIVTCESLFHYDSLSTLAYLAQEGDVFNENMRFAVAIYKIDALFMGLTIADDMRLTVMNDVRERFFAEFNGDASLRQQLNDKYRTYRAMIQQVLSDGLPDADECRRWQTAQAQLLQTLALTYTQDKATLRSILISLIHMVINRLFPSKQRAYELVVYHCLAKHYDSVLARQKTKVTSA